jgi:hypothetical protein
MAMRRLLWAVLSVLFLLQVADVVTSNAVMASQIGASEVNPVMRSAMEHFGALWWLPKAVLGGGIVLLASLLRGVSRRTMAAAIAVTGAYVAVILNNLACL